MNRSDLRRNQLLMKHRGLIIHFALKKVQNESERDDVIQDAFLLAMVPAATYKPGPRKFSSYATPWLTRRLDDARNQRAHAVQMPDHLIRLFRVYNRTEQQLIAAGGRPSIAEVIAAMNIDKIAGYLHLKAANLSRSLALAVGESRRESVASSEAPLASPESDDPATLAARREEIELVRAALGKLPARVRRVLCQARGLDGHPETPTAEIARQEGVSRQSIHNWCLDGEELLRAELARRGLSA